jgi:hypothetical protein
VNAALRAATPVKLRSARQVTHAPFEATSPIRPESTKTISRPSGDQRGATALPQRPAKVQMR